MSKPRPIITKKRLQMVQLITRKVKSYTDRLDAIIEDLSKEHVDSPAKAKEVRAVAIKLKRKLAAAA